MLVICVNNDWVPSSLDIKTAFLQGRGFDKEVLLEPPMEANVPTGHVWRLKKPVYGLKEASLKWYESLMDFLEPHGGMRTTIDPCLVMFTSMGKLCGMMAIHVDDICYAGTRKWKEGFIPELGKRFPLGSEKHGSFTYIGLEVSTLLSEDGHIVGIYVSQKEYIESLEVVPVDGKPHDSLDPNEITLFRSLLGKLMWIAGQTRPDIAFKVCNLSLGLAHPGKKHLTLAHRIVKYLKGLHVPLIYRPFVGDWTFIVYSGASFGTAEGCASIEGNLIFFWGGSWTNESHLLVLKKNSTSGEEYCCRGVVGCQ